MNVDADTPATAPDTTPTDQPADVMAALDAGIAAADAETAPAAEPAPVETPPADAATPPADDPSAVPPADGQPPAQPQEGAPPADGQPAAAAEGEQQPDADTEAEIASLGLKEKSAERFRGMAAEIKQSRATVDALKAAGIEDVASLPDLVQRSKVGEDMVQMVVETGASAEQYGMALDYLGLISKAQQGDMVAAEKAYTTMTGELAALAKLLGKEVPGVHDPLANHQDLRAEVEAGDLPRARAVEIAGQRDRTAYTGSVERQRTESQQAVEQARQDAFDGLQAYDAEMKATDPSYLAKREVLQGHVKAIMATYPPREWERRTAIAYASIKLPEQPMTPAAPAAPAQPRPGPMRPSGPRPAMDPTTFASPMDALEYGIQQANNG
ncbi:hypothetical protein [Stenotrophomonas maltophilia]|uniref:hypothetical protein n=1 Tax=Stenotrophomonas maltophilia TaxID=40324 RepID=UPI000DA2DB88|nr:hypothetical protein [Stenotrophomonas maltophilia]MBA0416155.1 hypothetical protein [Stenotrophomonas maltophilia]MBH1749331.1 hypothetical protein [Stenotrophomonas maltophilia]MCU1200040.1 hypothetical protein [Stenotrophomonas maltophilia]SQG66934.1 Uncharacterised protein [Stenotrophomonas maltophilia]